MARTRSRMGSAFVLGFVLLLALGATAALACLEPKGYGGPQAGGPATYGPNDPVPFKITGTTEGAGYYISLDGSTVVEGVDPDGGGETGSFTMPDLGSSARSVELRFDVSHEASTEYVPTTQTLQFAPPVATQQPQAQEPAPPAESLPGGDQGQEHEQAGPAGDRGADHGSIGSSAASDSPASASAPARPAPVGAPTPSAPVSNASEPVSEAQAPARLDRFSEGAGTSERSSIGDGAARSIFEDIRPRLQVSDSAPVAQVRSVPEAPQALPGDPAFVAGLAALLLVAIGGLTLPWSLRRGSGPGEPLVASPTPWLPPEIDAAAKLREAVIEAELQEIIAVERARILLRPRTIEADSSREATERERPFATV